jgi:5-methylcytosine-specific restriction protein A
VTLRSCVVCGEVTAGSRCPEHEIVRTPKPNATERGYNAAWFRLSRRARQLQPWCSVCGTKDDLTGDHLRWPARTIKDVDVLCRSHNSKRGAAR